MRAAIRGASRSFSTLASIDRARPVRQERLLGEFTKRVGDPNLGGADRRKGIITVYRQRAVAIARFLRQHPPAKASLLRRRFEIGRQGHLYRDVYGWFEHVSRHVCPLSRGQQEIRLWQPPDEDGLSSATPS